MTFKRALAISFLVHLGAVGYAHLFPGTSVADSLRMQVEFDRDSRSVDVRRVEAAIALEDSETTSQSPIPGVDVSAGLDGSSDSEPAASSADDEQPDPDPEPAEPSSSSEPAKQDDDESTSVAERAESSADDDEAADAPDPADEQEAEPVVAEKTDEAPAESTDDESASADDSDDADEVAASEAGTEDGSEEGTGGEEARAAAGTDGEGGGGAGEGDGSGSDGGGVDRGELLRGYADSIYEVIARHRSYPSAARRAGLEGTVQVEIEIDRAGEILNVDVHESSGHRMLDDAAVEAIESVDKLPDPPEALAWQQKRLRIPIRYDLNRHG